MLIRKIQQEDNAPLATMIRAVFDEHEAPRAGTVYTDPTTDTLFEGFQQHGSVLWVAELNNEPVGCCGIYPTERLPANCAEMVKFYIYNHARGKGVGKALMQNAVNSALALGYRQLYLESLPHFARALTIYEKLGFREIDQPMGKSGHTGCNVWMIKDLEL